MSGKSGSNAGLPNASTPLLTPGGNQITQPWMMFFLGLQNAAVSNPGGGGQIGTAISIANNALAVANQALAEGGVELVASIAELRGRTTTTLPGTYCFVEGYYTQTDGGQGGFLVITGSSVPDDGGMVIHDASGRVWARVTNNGPYDVKWFGAKGDGATDDTGAFQAALNYCSSIGGGQVNVPVSRYFFSGVLTIPSYCGLCGITDGEGPDYINFAATTSWPVLLVTNTSTAFITMEGAVGQNTDIPGGTYMTGLIFWYPNQVTWSSATPVVYPATIHAYKTSYMERLYMVNPYHGIILNGGRSYLINIQMGALQTGISMDQVYDFVWVDNFHVGLQYAYWPLGASYTLEPLDAWVKANRTCFSIARVDDFKFSNIGLYWGQTAFTFIDSTVAQTSFQCGYGTAVNVSVDVFSFGISATATNSTAGGVMFSNLNLNANTLIQTNAGGTLDPYILWNGGCGRNYTPGAFSTGMVLNAAVPSVVASHVVGLTPFGIMGAGVQPAAPASGVTVQNAFPWEVQVYLTGFTAGAITHIFLNGVGIGDAQTTWIMSPGDTIELTYTGSITWQWVGLI